ncbi:molybdate ABC transporter substrate-binding protein [Rhodobacteraceae bacterium DSL-40]|uniref:molybdate ABC transporter substrate-binding protein n=1 Tax=Amaricoccus sp. B4 TaxID=3368557 RepID=UPI000DACB457
MTRLMLALLVTATAGTADAGQTNVAVAANFTGAAKDIAEAFKAATGDEAVLSFGSTGQLYTQIAQGAPFDVFLAADNVRPDLAVTEGFAVEGTEFTYAIGQLALWSRDTALVNGAETMKRGDFHKLAIANPETAPYGAAAVQVMQALDVFEALFPKVVQGNNIAQTYQFVETGNAELGFVAYSQIAASDEGSRWLVDPALYDPIRQDAVLLQAGAGNAAAQAFLDFLKGPEAAAVIERYGYAIEKGD